MFIKNLNHRVDLKIFFTILLSLTLLCSSHTYAQKSGNSTEIEKATVVLKGGAKIFSSDEAFNNLISNNIVILKNADVAPVNKNSANVLKATSLKPEITKEDLKKEVESEIEKRQKEEIKKIEKEIDQHKERKKAFKIIHYQAFPSSDEFIASTQLNKDSVVSSYTKYDLSNIFDLYSCKYSLSYLHTQKFTQYNNKSLDFCWSLVFSARPPPSHS